MLLIPSEVSVVAAACSLKRNDNQWETRTNFSSDATLNEAAQILRLLHIEELRELQTKINEAIVAVQAIIADPKTDHRLGKVGRWARRKNGTMGVLFFELDISLFFRLMHEINLERSFQMAFSFLWGSIKVCTQIFHLFFTPLRFSDFWTYNHLQIAPFSPAETTEKCSNLFWRVCRLVGKLYKSRWKFGSCASCVFGDKQENRTPSSTKSHFIVINITSYKEIWKL